MISHVSSKITVCSTRCLTTGTTTSIKFRNSLLKKLSLHIYSPQMNMSDKPVVVDAKRNAAQRCVQDNVKSGQVIGIGTGSTSFYAIESLGEKYKCGQVNNIICVPTSVESKQLLIKNRLPISDLDRHCEIDVYIDGADEVDQNLNCIKGAGGCLTEEKIVMSCSKKFYIIADYRKRSILLGDSWKSIPIEVCRTAYVPIRRRIEEQEGGMCKLRTAVGKAGPMITDHNNYILDWFFPPLRDKINDRWDLLNTRLKLIPGVVETGLFLNCAHKAYFGMENGSVCVFEAPNERINGFSNGKDAD